MNTSRIAALPVALFTGLVAISGCSSESPATQAAASTCSPTASIVPTPFEPGEVQAKAVNDNGDIVGFAPGPDTADSHGHAILWKSGEDEATDLGVLPGYVASEAYGVNNDRVVVGILYDEEGTKFPFRWSDGTMEVLKGPDGDVHPADGVDRNYINASGQIAGVLVLGKEEQLTAVLWSPDGKATALPKLPGHAWSFAFSVNDQGLVSGWSRKEPKPDAEENPVLWPTPGELVAMKTAPNRADGIAEATNASGLTVGYLGNLGTPEDPEADEAVFWDPQTAEPTKVAPLAPEDTYGELVDVNDAGQAAGMSGTFGESYPIGKPAVWQSGESGFRALPVPAEAESTGLPVVTTLLNDINAQGVIVGNTYALDPKDAETPPTIFPVVWSCAFGK